MTKTKEDRRCCDQNEGGAVSRPRDRRAAPVSPVTLTAMSSRQPASASPQHPQAPSAPLDPSPSPLLSTLRPSPPSSSSRLAQSNVSW